VSSAATRAENVALPRLLAGIRPDRALTLAEHRARFGPLARPQDLVAELDAAGLRGRGGGAFPVADKLRAAAVRRRRPIVVANAAEGEPASSKDKALVRHSPHLVLDGAVLAAAALGAREVVVAVARSASTERLALVRALAERREPIELATVPDGFVSGEETALLNALGGGPAKPTLKPPYPFESGLGGAPTLVQNAETLAHVALIARFGAGWFGSGTALVTLSGSVARPGVHEIELGSTLGETLRRAGGTSETVSAFLVGGYFGRWIAAADAIPMRLTPEVLGAGAIVAFPARDCAVAECARVARYLSNESAGQCGPCVYGLAAIADALERPTRESIPKLHRWTAQVRGRGACRHPDGAAQFVESALAVFGDELAQHAQHGGCRRKHRRILPL
jgi:NADH:ubiquinone oxidoreductase subunit F (NADH-binding)